MQHNGKKALVHEKIIEKMRNLVGLIDYLKHGELNQGPAVLVCETLIEILKESELKPEHRDWVLAKLEELEPNLNWVNLENLIIQLRDEQEAEKVSR